MQGLSKETIEESRRLLRDELKKYSKSIGVNPDLGIWDRISIVNESFIRNFYNPTIIKRISDLWDSSLACKYGRNFSEEQLIGRLAEVLRIQESEAVKLLPGLLSETFGWTNRKGRQIADFEVSPFGEGGYRVGVLETW